MGGRIQASSSIPPSGAGPQFRMSATRVRDTVTIDGSASRAAVNGVSASGCRDGRHTSPNSALTGNSCNNGMFVKRQGRRQSARSRSNRSSFHPAMATAPAMAIGDNRAVEYRGDPSIPERHLSTPPPWLTADTAIPDLRVRYRLTTMVDSPIGTVIINSVEVNGSFGQVGVYIRVTSNLSGLSVVRA